MKNTRIKNVCIFTIIFLIQALSVNAQVTFEEVLKNPNDLKLNLKYAKEQEDLGNFKSVISTLERLTSLYPENIDLKMYYLSISLRIDSVERTIQIIDEIKNSEQLTAEINAEIDIILQNINNTANANENKWNGYIDISLNHTYHTNINNLSDSGTFYVSDSISNYATNEIENDTLEIPSIRIGGFKKLTDNSNINLNIGLSDTHQDRDKSEEKDLNSVFLNHNFFKDNNLFSTTFSFNKSNYRNQADINTINFGLRDKYSINKNHFLIGGINYTKNTYNQNNTFSTTREKNNYFVSGNIGYEFIFSRNKFLFDYKDGESKAIADQYGYKQEKYLISYFRYFDFGTLNLSKSFTENEYAIADTFVLSNTVRDDELDTTSISLNGELVNLYFLNKFKFFEDIYYNLSFSKIDSTSNILNYNYEKEIHNIGLTKRINF